LEPTGLLREQVGAHRGAEIHLAAMVTTRNNHDNQQANQEGNSSVVLAKMRRELEMMRKLREEDRLQREEERVRQVGAHDALREENERLRQRLERMERGQHSINVHAEGDNSRSEERSEPGSHKEEPRQERQMEVLGQEERDETSRLIEDSSSHQFPFTEEILATKLSFNWNNPRWTSMTTLQIRTNTSMHTSLS